MSGSVLVHRSRSGRHETDAPTRTIGEDGSLEARFALGAMELLERETQLAALERAYARAAEGGGGVVVVSGEAGSGKTALVRRFVERCPARVLWGMCDDMSIPRPLGPFLDMASGAGGALRSALEDGPQMAIPDAVLAEMGSPPGPVVAVIEDAHWADDVTLELIRFLARRLESVPALLVVTHRDDEGLASQALGRALSTAPRSAVTRLSVGGLSQDALASLPGVTDAAALHATTGGNPFYVAEVLANPRHDVPVTVQDAVMARVARLGPSARRCLETASVVPSGHPRWLLDAAGVAGGLDGCVAAGLLTASGDTVAFSHEIARRAIEQSLAPERRRDANRLVLSILEGRGVEPARLAHHAYAAGDSTAVAQYAPAAARRAVRLHAHVEAIGHYRQALTLGDDLPSSDRVRLLEEYAAECRLASDLVEATAALEAAVELREARGDSDEMVADLAFLSEVHWARAQGAQAEDAARRAVAELRPHSPDAPRAAAYAALAKLAMVDVRTAEAIEWGEKAVAHARASGDAVVLANALNTVGATRHRLDPTDDALVRESLELALAEDLHDGTIARAYVNLAVNHIEGMQYEAAGAPLADGLAYCDRHDVYVYTDYLLSIRAWWHMEQGRWREAECDVRQVLGGGDSVVAIRALRVLGLIQGRHGQIDQGRQSLERALALSERLGESQGTVPIAAALAELAWLEGDEESAIKAVDAMHRRALETGIPRWLGETTIWLHRAGADVDVPAATPEPYVLMLAGRFGEAADAWARLGRVYEEADSRAETDDPAELLEALAVLDRLGARPRAAMVRARLASLGVRGVPRGPTTATLASPAGLTPRQTEVLHLLAEGLTYRQIADRLFVSAKTVDHHVAAVRLKLDVTNRADAIDAAGRLGILPTRDGEPGGPE